MTTPEQRIILAHSILDEVGALLLRIDRSGHRGDCSDVRSRIDAIRGSLSCFDAVLVNDRFSIEILSNVLSACSSMLGDALAEDYIPIDEYRVGFPRDEVVKLILDACKDSNNTVLDMNINDFMRFVGWQIVGDDQSSTQLLNDQSSSSGVE